MAAQPLGTIAAFGKVPAAGDFLRSQVQGEPITSFESWLTDGLAAADERLGQRFAQSFLNGPIYAFVHRTAAAPGKLLAGVIRPSRDAVGRRYPFVVCTAFEAGRLAGAPHLLPLVLGDFLEAATNLATSVDHLRSQSELEAGLARMPRFSLDSADAANHEYTQWLHNTSVAMVWTAVYGQAAPMASYRAIHTIEQCVAGFRGREAPSTPLGLRLPLGGAGPAAAAFWLDLVRNVAQWKQTVPSCFWCFDGRDGSMLLHFGEVPLRSASELWVGDSDSDNVCDLTGSSSIDPSRFMSQLPPGIAELVYRDDASVGHLMAALAR